MALGSFIIKVIVNSESTATLIEEIEGLPLSTGAEAALTANLRQISRILEDNNPRNDGAACDKLSDFLDKVDSSVESGRLSAEDAALLSGFGVALGEYLECS